MKKEALLIFFLCLPLALGVSISPASYTIDFVPKEKVVLSFKAFGTEQGSAFVAGDLSEYATIDNPLIQGGGEFLVTIRYPEYIETPGRHKMLVGVREGEVGGGQIGSRAVIQAPVFINVPYPGKYGIAEMSLRSINKEEPLVIFTYLENKGKNGIKTAFSHITILRGQEIAYQTTTESVSLDGGEKKTITTTIPAGSLPPGDYLASATISFDDEKTSLSRDFKVGDKDVAITNYTRELPAESISKFLIDVESRWNNPIGKVSAIIRVSQNNTLIDEIKTPSETLPPWEKKTLSGYFDTTGLHPGVYDSEIILQFDDLQKTIIGELVLTQKLEEESPMNFSVSDTTLLLLAILIIITNIHWFFHNREEKHKPKKKHHGKKRH